MSYTENAPLKVIKRDGSTVAFDKEKIATAIKKAGAATGQYSDDVVAELTTEVIRHLSLEGFTTYGILSIEAIQDTVERILAAKGYFKTFRAYALYREQRAKTRQDKRTVVDVESSMNEYLERKDWRVRANANQGYSLGGLILNVSGKVTANYWLNHIYPPEIGEAHRNGDLHIHDLDMLSGYCAGWSLRTLLQEGLNGVPGKVEATPPKHMSSAVGQIVNFLGTLQNEWAGAQAFSSFDTYMAPYIRKDGMSFEEVKQNIQELIYNLNVPSRWGCVDAETEVLSTEGWKKHDELKEGDTIYTWKGGKLNTCSVRKVVVKQFDGQLHRYGGRNYEQVVTPNHRVLTFDHNSTLDRIRTSEEIFHTKTPYRLPTQFSGSYLEGNSLSDDEVTLAAMLYADGNIDIRGESVHHVSYIKSENRWGGAQFEEICARLGLQYSKTTKTSSIGVANGYPIYEVQVYRLSGDSAKKAAELIGNSKKHVDTAFKHLDRRQAKLFLSVWSQHDGNPEKKRIQCDNAQIVADVQHIAVLAGYSSYLKKRANDRGVVTTYVKLRQTRGVYPTVREAVEYSGIVWCPNTEDGTAVFRRRGSVFISGNSQAPFTNLTFDWTCPDDLKPKRPIIGGEEMAFTYGDLQPEMDMINRAYIEVMTTGDAKGRVFTFPIPTYNITKDFPWESENVLPLFEMTAKYGIPYFQNFINSDLEPHMIRSMCCRLQLRLDELLKRGNGLFGSAEQTGSIGVVTINCARLGYLYQTWDELTPALDRLLVLAKNSLEIKRKEIQRRMDAGLFPYTKRYLGTLRNHFSTIGVNGINEMIRNFSGGWEDVTSNAGRPMAIHILDHIRAKMTDFQKETGHLYNMEASPAEGAVYRFAREDKKRFPDILQAGTPEKPYYTNSSQLPVGFTNDPFEALAMQEELQKKYTGGTVLHLYLGERVSSAEACKRLIKTSLERFGVPYITVTPTFSICPSHGYLIGEHQECPDCGATCEVWTRVMGYYRPVSAFNTGKQGEYEERVCFEEPKGELS